jgi:hypothetical protein
MTAPGTAPAGPDADLPAPAPLTLAMDVVPAMVNTEIADHPVYDGLELQWFDDVEHGTGMLAFLSRRADRAVDYYAQPGLRLDPARYHVGGGTGSWQEAVFDVARLEVADDGVDVEVRFHDADGRPVEIVLRDRDGHRRRRGGLLAPVGSGIDEPTSLFLVWMPAFDLLHATGPRPVIRIDGQEVTTGRLPGARLHRRLLVKTAAPVVAVHVNLVRDGAPAPAVEAGRRELDPDGRLTAVAAGAGDHEARLRLFPGMPAPSSLADDERCDGRWDVVVDGTVLCAGRWRAARSAGVVTLAMDVDRPWRPRRLPPLLRVVTTVAPVFRRWPTTYRWRCTVALDEGSPVARWERTVGSRDESYRRATRS